MQKRTKKSNGKHAMVTGAPVPPRTMSSKEAFYANPAAPANKTKELTCAGAPTAREGKQLI